jgi:hypothetical protein
MKNNQNTSINYWKDKGLPNIVKALHEKTTNKSLLHIKFNYSSKQYQNHY